MQLIVLGMHQSGLSVVARLLNMMGMYFGSEDSGVLPRAKNPKGTWERNDVLRLNERLLTQNGASWRNVLPFDWQQISEASREEFKEQAAKILFRLEPHRPWFIKDPRLSLTLPLWQPLFELPIYIIVVRNPLEIARSLEKRDDLPIGAGLALWQRHLADALNATREGPRIFINHRDLVSNPPEAARKLAGQLAALGVPLRRQPTDQELEAFISPTLHRTKVSDEELATSQLLSHDQLEAWNLLQALQATDTHPPIDLAACNAALEAHLPLEIAHAERVRVDALEHENLYLCERLEEEIRKNRTLFSQLRRQEKTSADSSDDSPQETESHFDSAAHFPANAQPKHAPEASNGSKQTEERFFLLANLLKKLEDELQRRLLQLQEKITQAEDILDTLAPSLKSAPRRKDSPYDDEYEIYHLKDRLFKKEKIIRRLMSWADDLQKTIPLNSTARKSQRYYKYWRSRYKESAIKPLAVPLSTLKQDAEVRNMRTRENDNRLKASETDLRNLLIDLEHEDFFGGLDFSKIYALTGVDLALLASGPEARKYRLRDFSHGKEPLVSIIIPVHNQIGYTLACLRSLSKVREATPFEVIIIDDCSAEENYQRIKSIAGIQVVRNETNLGFVGSCNKGAALAKGAYTLFLNNDVKVLPGWLDSLVQTFKNRPEAGLVGSKLLYPDHRLQEAGGIIWRDGSGANFGRNDDPDKPEYNFLRETDYCSGACIMLPSDLLKKVGYFDIRYTPAYYEDTDLAFKVRAAGRRVYYQPASAIIHFEGKSNGTDVRTGVKKYQTVNADKFVEKWRSVLDTHSRKGENLFFAREGTRKRPLLVVLDHYIPKPDHDAGSRSTFQYIKMFLDLGLKVKFIPNNFRAPQPYTRALEHLGVEVLYGAWYQANIRKWLVEHQGDIDYIFANRSHITAPYLDVFAKMPDTKVLYYGHDLGSLRNQRKYETTGHEDDALEAKKEEKLEMAIWQQVHTVYYPSEEETAIVRSRVPKVQARTLPLYILEPKAIDYLANIEQRHDLLFVGGFAHTPNEDAVLWFLDHCWPQIETALPDVRFRVVGSHPTTQIERRASERVIVTGWISDAELEMSYLQTRMAVIPLRYGAGVKGKVVEAMHNHLPIVMTTIAAEGLPGAGQFTVVEDDAAQLAHQIIELYQDTPRLAAMAESSGRYIAEHFAYEVARSILAEDIQSPALPQPK